MALFTYVYIVVSILVQASLWLRSATSLKSFVEIRPFTLFFGVALVAIVVGSVVYYLAIGSFLEPSQLL